MEKRRKSTYSEEFKLRVVKEVLEGKFNKEEARRVYGIKSNCAILYWIRQFSGQSNYRESGISHVDIDQLMSKKESIDQEKRIKELEEELRKEKLRAELWQKVVDIAEKDLAIDIKKKYGAK